jgi:hypothetical protein
MQERARFPEVAAKAGHYESFYIKACRPDGGQGVWIRHTVHKRPGAEPNASIWFCLFDREAEGPRATKATVPAAQLDTPAGSWIRVADAEIGPGRAEGSVDTEALSAAWSFTFSGDAEPCKYLPADWLYKAPLPKTKFLAPYPDARFQGRLEIDDQTFELSGWPGMIGHNWGSEHAERWVWLHGAGFGGRDDGTFLDVAAGRVRLGGRTTPYVANGVLSLDGVRHQLGGLTRTRATRLAERPDGCRFRLPGRGVTVQGAVEAPRKDVVGWVYADPAGGRHEVVNCSIATLRLVVHRPGRDPVELESDGGAAYELGMRERDHGVPLQPYPDGPRAAD